ncbi:MAG: polysaccharide pyruvyl transferase family protein [Acidobacteriaceae bacterium]|nr:polysaccharide pyruvyl transferase family protein [Acidobacteriaceae bacterium]
MNRNNRVSFHVNLDRQLVRNFAEDLLRLPDAAARRWRLLKQQKRAIGYVGWVGHDNLGDEVVSKVIRQALGYFPMLNLFPELGERLLSQFGLGGPAMFRAVLLGGGTLINPSYLPVVRFLKAQGLPIHTVGTGVGNPGFGDSHNDDDSLQEWAGILRESPFVSVRGPLSAELLQQAGVVHTEVIGDPALALTPDIAPAFRSRRRLVINLSQESSRHQGAGYGHFFKIVKGLVNEFVTNGGEIVGVALGAGDRQALEQFRCQSGLASMSIEDHRRSGESFLSTVSASQAIVSVRLHAAVLASCVGVPSLLLAYRLKCRDFMSSMGVESFAVPLSKEMNASIIRDRFQQILSSPVLGEKIYKQALFWKQKQVEYCKRLAANVP